MKASLSVAAASTAVLASTAAAQRVLSVPVARSSAARNSISRRASNTYTESLTNNLTAGAYYATVSLGTPAQSATLVLDTGSSDVWVLASSSDICSSEMLQQEYGSCISTFDPSSSSTYKLVQEDGFEIQYADNSGAEGNYISDTFRIGGATVTALQMGLAFNSTVNTGICGIGFDNDEAAESVYPNLIDTLKSQGLIAVRAYSLYLDDLDDSTGSLLFGGIDTEKFIGTLQEVDIQPETAQGSDQSVYAAFQVSLSSLKVSGLSDDSNVLDGDVFVVLDSGTTLTYLPPNSVSTIYNAVGAYDDSQQSGFVYINCDYTSKHSDVTFDYQFGDSGPTIKVPVSEVIIDNVQAYLSQGLVLPSDLPWNSDNVCSFGIQGDDQLYLLGDTFLRSAYVVYDLDNKKIGLAQTNLNSSDSNVVEISASGIPLQTGVASQITQAASTTAPTSTATSGTTSGSNPSTISASASPSGSASGGGGASAATVVAPSWEVMSVTLVAAFFGFVGTAVFTL
ncbi:aspartic peptidase domain-containing protein [Xylariaceae sp. FL0255]|nr:aspartic peptidase domain-containing protein [Xylariaceae sp. FL0255]